MERYPWDPEGVAPTAGACGSCVFLIVLEKLPLVDCKREDSPHAKLEVDVRLGLDPLLERMLHIALSVTRPA